MTTQTETAIMKDYAAAGGLRTYYEAQGTGDPLVLLHVSAASPASRNRVINANTSPGRRVTPTCVVPGGTASCASGRMSNISTTSGNGEKSRSPKRRPDEQCRLAGGGRSAVDIDPVR